MTASSGTLSRRHQVVSFLVGATVGVLIGYWTDMPFTGPLLGLMMAAAYIQFRTRHDDPQLSFWHANTQTRTPFRVLVCVLVGVALLAALPLTWRHSHLVQYSALWFILGSYWALIYVWWRRDVQKYLTQLDAAPASGTQP